MCVLSANHDKCTKIRTFAKKGICTSCIGANINEEIISASRNCYSQEHKSGSVVWLQSIVRCTSSVEPTAVGVGRTCRTCTPNIRYSTPVHQQRGGLLFAQEELVLPHLNGRCFRTVKLQFNPDGLASLFFIFFLPSRIWGHEGSFENNYCQTIGFVLYS